VVGRKIVANGTAKLCDRVLGMLEGVAHDPP
jgi:hypothetical protein